METILIIRNGEIKLTIPASVDAAGRVYGPQGTPVIDGTRLAADGVDVAGLKSRMAAHALTAADLGYIAHYGDNGGGLVVLWAEDYRRQQEAMEAPARAARAARMEALFPGLSQLRAALEDEERYREEFNRMVADKDNAGARPPAPVKIHYQELAPKYPAAVAYLHAEAYSQAANYAKATAGSRALGRLETGEPHAAVITAMEAEWTKAAEQAVWNS